MVLRRETASAQPFQSDVVHTTKKKNVAPRAHLRRRVIRRSITPPHGRDKSDKKKKNLIQPRPRLHIPRARAAREAHANHTSVQAKARLRRVTAPPARAVPRQVRDASSPPPPR